MSAREVVGRMPIWFLLFIASSGIFLVLSLPIDIFSSSVLNFENGFSLSVLSSVPKFFEQNFTPFIMIKYLGSGFPIGTIFPVGLIEIILLGLVMGSFMYLFSDVYQWINGRVFRGRIKRWINSLIARRRARRGVVESHLPLETPEGKFDEEEFVGWLGRTKLEGWFDFISSFKSVTQGLLYGAETFGFVNFIRLIVLGIGGLFFGIDTGLVIESAAWFGVSILILGVLYIFEVVYLWTWNNRYGDILQAFNNRAARTGEY